MWIAISDDDRDQHRVLRIRVVWEKPSVGCAEFFGALLKDYGFDAEECLDATLQGLQRLCSTRSEKQLKGTHAELVADLWDDVRRKIFCGATDGAAVALKGMGLMTEHCPGLRYQFRDRPHTTRTCVKNAFELCPESAEMRRRLLTGQHSFARRAKHSRRFQQVWIQKQRDEPDALWTICQDFGYAEQRYHSKKG